MRAIAKLRLLRAVQRWAAAAGRLDAAGQLGTLGVEFVRSARREARAAGCPGADIDELTIEGLEQGRSQRCTDEGKK